MKQVLMQAEKLAQSIVDSEVFITMRRLENELTKDEQAAAIIMEVSEKRQAVEAILASCDLDHEALAKAADSLETAENAMEANELVTALKKARAEFSQMMSNVNQILRFVVTGETGEEEGGCSGSCGSCGGCHNH